MDEVELNEDIKERRWRKILGDFSVPANKEFLPQWAGDKKLDIKGKRLDTAVKDLETIAAKWADFDSYFFDHSPHNGDTLFKKFEDLRFSMSWLPSEDGTRSQFKDWIIGRLDEQTWTALETFISIWRGYGDKIIDWLKMENLATALLEVSECIELFGNRLPNFKPIDELTRLNNNSKWQVELAQLEGELKQIPSIDRVLFLCSTFKGNPLTEKIHEAAKRVKNVCAELEKTKEKKSETNDRALIGKMEGLEPLANNFKEGGELSIALSSARNRVSLINSMREKAAEGNLDYFLILRQQLPENYSFDNSPENEILLKLLASLQEKINAEANRARESLKELESFKKCNSEVEDRAFIAKMKGIEPAVQKFPGWEEFSKTLSAARKRIALVQTMVEKALGNNFNNLDHLRQELPKDYQLEDSEKNQKLIECLKIMREFGRLNSETKPAEATEKALCQMEMEFNKPGLKLPDEYQNRFETARIRLKILEELRALKPIGPAREKSVADILDGFESHFTGWDLPDPKFQSDWKSFQQKKERDSLAGKIEDVINSKNPRAAQLLVERINQCQGFQKNNSTIALEDLASRGLAFNGLLASLGGKPDYALVQKRWNEIFNPSPGAQNKKNLPQPDYTGFKDELSQLVKNSLAGWIPLFKKIEISDKDGTVFFLTWDWNNKILVNRVFFSLTRNYFPKNPLDANYHAKEVILVKEKEPGVVSFWKVPSAPRDANILVKEVEPTEHEMGSMPNTTFLLADTPADEYILTVWPSCKIEAPPGTPSKSSFWINYTGYPKYFPYSKKTSIIGKAIQPG